MTKLKGIILALICCQTLFVFADHVSGANITYACTDTPNEFLITVTLYRDCSGIPAPNSVAISADNTCDLGSLSLVLPLISSSEVSQLCASEQENSTCNDGVLPGMQEYTYQNTVVLPDTCDAWTFSYSVCARNQPLVNLVGNSCLYVETTMFSGTQACNNTPTINAQPIPYVCNNIPVTYDLGILEQDGDSLSFSFVEALTTGAISVPYATSFTGDFPMNGINIDPNSGSISFTPIVNGHFVIVILIEEFNQNGELVGTLMHEFQFIVQNCTNTPPEAPISVSNFNDFGTNADLIGNNMVSACVDDQFCLDVVFSDVDSLDTLVLSSNVLDFLPEATFTQTGTNPATATICWHYQPGYTGSIISIYATDGVCPIIGFATFVIELDLPPPLYPGADSTLSFCESIGEIDLFDYLSGYHTTNGTWFSPTYEEIPSTVMTDTIPSGTYTYVVYADPSSCIPSDSAQLHIGNGHVSALWHEDSLQNLSCYGIEDGSAYVDSIYGENGPFTVVWTGDNGLFESSITPNLGSSYQDDLYLGLWNVTITDTIGCYWSHDFDLSQPGLINLDLQHSPPQCHGMTNGSITAFASNTQGIDDFFTIIDPNQHIVNLNGTNTANNLGPGWHTITITDSANCEIIDSVEIIPPAPISIQLSIENPLCFGDNTGQVRVDTVYNSQGDYDDIYYNWNPNLYGRNGLLETGLNHIPAGEYHLEITDDFGCTQAVNFTISNPNPLIGQIQLISPTYCRTEGFQNGNGEVAVTTADINSSGTGNITYHWLNGTNGETSHNTTFIVSEPGWMMVTLKDDHNCTFVDSIYVDSLNPIADFTLVSDQFEGPGEFEGTESLNIQLINESLNFAKPSHPLADSTFKITWYNNEPGNENGNWFFSYDYTEKIDTVLWGEVDYEVCLIAKNHNNCKDTLCKIVRVHAIPELDIPNVFTPGMAPNETFFFPARGIEAFNCSIFNRYGIEVYRFTQIEQEWNGNDMKTQTPCIDGVYYYTYNATTNNGKTLSGQGNVHLIRPK